MSAVDGSTKVTVALRDAAGATTPGLENAGAGGAA